LGGIAPIVVNLPRMNYFELFELPVGFTVDQALLKRQFYVLSRKYHPDFFTLSGPAEQAEVLEKSSMVNKGYKTFLQPDLTMQYLLQLKGLVEPEEKYPLSPVFLGEVMEINEQLMELEMAPDLAELNKVETATNELLKTIYHDVEGTMAGYQEGITPEKALLPVKDYYYQKKYLQRILDKIASLRNIAPRT
jgi:molecular chaperone HscB